MKPAVHVVVALLVNAGLFLLIAKTQTTAKAKPAKENWVVREAFTAAPPPLPPAPPEDAARVMAAEPVSPAASAPALSSDSPAPEAFAPRLEGMSFDLGALGIGGGPPVPVFKGIGGGSPDGVPGGIAGGVAGGTGSGALRLSQVDRGPQRLVTPLPPYPQWARVRRLEGTVTLQFTVDAEGGVKDVAVDAVEGDERFGPVAVQAVASWRYEPGLYGGRKVPVRMIQRVRFNLVDRVIALLLAVLLSQDDAIAGEKAYRDGRYAEAADLFEKAAAKDAKNPGLWIALGHASLQAGRHDPAIRAYRQAIALKPEGADAHRSLAQALALAGRLEEAIGSYRKAGQLEPDGGDSLSIARLRAQREEWLQAEHELALYLRIAPSSIEALELLSFVLVRAGKPDQAAEIYKVLSRRKPLEPKYLLAWGQAEASRGRYGEAADVLEIASRLGEANADTLRLLADLYLQQQMHLEAAAAYTRMLAATKEPKADDYLRLGHAHLQGGETASARAAFEKARGIDPTLTAATLQLAQIAAGRGESDQARKEFEAAVKGSTGPAACEALGDFEFKAGDFTRAAAAFAESVRRGGNGRAALAAALHGAGKPDEARAALREALRHAPHDERLRALLRQLDK